MTELLASKSLENKEEWVAWRESLDKSVVFGSQFPAWSGHHYDSLASVVDTLHGRKEKPEPNYFQQTAMDHGTKNEADALDYFFKIIQDSPAMQKGTGLAALQFQMFAEIPSRLLALQRDPETKLLLTPDALLLVTDPTSEISTTCVVEVKCPFTQASKFESIQEWTDSFCEDHPLGYTSAFLQAALYASVDQNCTEFFTIFYFIHPATNFRRLIAHQFKMTDELREWCLDNAQKFSACLREGKENLRVPSARKKEASQLQKDTWKFTLRSDAEFICYNLCSSDEEDSEESGQ